MSGVCDRARDLGVFQSASDDGRIICRCEEITKGEIRRAVHDGMFNLHEVRRFLRCGMGLCQGQTCGKLVRAIIARELNISAAELDDATARAPMRPLEMEIFGREAPGI
ncbi:MAG: (2Fe-2S)-binding protein [Oscillospiraceae bacterium]|jgi:NAD(P)H-nitrite reductase large subunit|nr:(2Fe-2S)-binding protein [Oscillospiraceae bacterium]